MKKEHKDTLINILFVLFMIAISLIYMYIGSTNTNNKHPNQAIQIKHLKNISNNINKPDTAIIYQKDSIVFIQVNKMFYRAKLQ
jgi:flagellar basal body-associated protein FliL